MMTSVKKYLPRQFPIRSADLEEGPDVNAVSNGVKCSPRTVTGLRARELGIPYVAYWYNCWKDDFPADLGKSVW